MKEEIEFNKKEWIENLFFVINEFIRKGKDKKLAEQLLVLIEQKVRHRLKEQKAEIKEMIEKKKKPEKCLFEDLGYHTKTCENCEYNSAIKDILKQIK